jgi:hypothetical protein
MANGLAVQLRSQVGAAGALAAAVTSWFRQLQRLVRWHLHHSYAQRTRDVVRTGFGARPRLESRTTQILSRLRTDSF